ncbi:hypothetical protein FXF51_44790 [Nonomuraea sp. PA05]|uniref:hypothetical protein n=1 Tax=Nonomuraea sp. PA05 TaxID=2604466 RepID=UPI0011D8A49A|nr:hypothetical protein [Nonomuraea sp. PA05]TYB56222.1 hypothetical protein FXF51_44790 [Nonomuraea sp. PA05]
MRIDDWITLGGVVAAMVTSGWALVYNRAGVQIGKANAATAAAAEKAAAEAAAVAQIERNREHVALRPPPPPEIEGYLEGESSHRALFGDFSVPRDYRVVARAWNGISHTPIALEQVVRANQIRRFCIEPWPEGRQRPQTREIEFEFWPPTETDGVEMWGCPCGRLHPDEQGHWRWRIPVSYIDVLDTIA